METFGGVDRITLTDRLTLSPPSGIYVTTQRWEPTVILAPGPPIVGGRATFDGSDVTAPLVNCVIPGTLAAGGQSFRCPGVTGDMLGAGIHAFGVALNISDGPILSAGVTWEVIANSEP